MELSFRALKVMQYLVACLVLLTITLLVWQHYGMERQVLEISANSGHAFGTRDDRTEGGASVATVKQDGRHVNMHCNMQKRFAWPFCSLWFKVGEAPKGTNFEDFETVSFHIRFRGPAPRSIMMYMYNFDPKRSKPNNWMSQKVNAFEFALTDDDVITLPMSLLRPPSWWVTQQKIPLLESGAALDRVTYVELANGSINTISEFDIQVSSIQFRGKLITQQRLTIILMCAWIICGVSWPLIGALYFRTQLKNREQRLAMVTALNLALQLETRELAGQAHTDRLTGALNREGLRDILVKQWRAPALLSETASIVFIDLDHFKSVNDMHGHPTGDEVLQLFAATVQRTIRASDKLVRWGGEEFLLVCTNTTAQQASHLAEKLKQAMRRQSWPCALQVTASFGVTAMALGEDIGDAIKRADQALYRAKANGRDCVEVA